MTQVRLHYLNDREGIIARETIEVQADTRRQLVNAVDEHVVHHHPLGSQVGRGKLGYAMVILDDPNPA